VDYTKYTEERGRDFQPRGDSGKRRYRFFGKSRHRNILFEQSGSTIRKPWNERFFLRIVDEILYRQKSAKLFQDAVAGHQVLLTAKLQQGSYSKQVLQLPFIRSVL